MQVYNQKVEGQVDFEFGKREKGKGSQGRGRVVGLLGAGGRAGLVSRTAVDPQWVERGSASP